MKRAGKLEITASTPILTSSCETLPLHVHYGHLWNSSPWQTRHRARTRTRESYAHVLRCGPTSRMMQFAVQRATSSTLPTAAPPTPPPPSTKFHSFTRPSSSLVACLSPIFFSLTTIWPCITRVRYLICGAQMSDPQNQCWLLQPVMPSTRQVITSVRATISGPSLPFVNTCLGGTPSPSPNTPPPPQLRRKSVGCHFKNEIKMCTKRREIESTVLEQTAKLNQ